MDLLQQTYGSSSSDDDDGLAQQAPPAAAPVVIASHDSTVVAQHHEHGPTLVAADALEQRKQEITRDFTQRTSGRGGGIPQLLRRRMTHEERAFAFRGYASKRQRRTIVDSNDAATARENERASVPLPPLFPSDSFLVDGECSTTRPIASSSLLPTRVRQRFNDHAGAVNDIQWSPTHSHLFVSASMDSTVLVWSTKENATPCRRKLTHHSKGVKSVEWATDGKRILSGGYDGCAAYVDPETTTVVQCFEYDGAATCVCFHPSDPHFVLVGTDRGRIFSHDLRQRSVVNTYQAAFGEVHDLLFLPGDEQRFVSSAGVKYRDASHQTLLIWDFRSSTLLTERLDRDMQPFQCLRLHPQKPWFVAQCSADYAVLFSSVAPYKKLQKGKARFEGSHEVQGFSIHCSFNRDGSIFATGDANGRLVYYETTTKAAVRSLQAYATPRTACLCTEFHPLEPSTLVTGGSSGDILLYGPPTSSYNNSQPHS